MIVVQLSGGLGNQMFQYAAARALAARRGTDLVLDSSWLDGTGGSVTGEVRRYELGCFELDAPLWPVEEVGRVARSRLDMLRRRVRLRTARPFLHDVVEPSFGQPFPGLRAAPDNSYLRGYWQNATYFSDVEPLLRAEFTFRSGVLEREPSLAEEIRRSSLQTVSVHVRRADYTQDPGVRERMGTLEPDYYARAIDIVSSRAGDLHVFLFTDDPDWCRAQLKPEHRLTILAATRAEADRWASFMHLMTLCNHHVLANSSFSWWGAWLNPSPAKIVVAPEPWLADARWDNSARIPADWLRIDRGDHHADQPPSTTRLAPVT